MHNFIEATVDCSYMFGYFKVTIITLYQKYEKEITFVIWRCGIPIVFLISFLYNIKYQKISGGWVKTQHFIMV